MDKLKTLKEVSEELGVHPSTVRSWAKAKIVPYHKIGRKYFFDIEELKKSTLYHHSDTKEIKTITSQHNGIAISNGYIQVYVGEHEIANKNGYVPLHHLIMRAILCRPLEKDEIVHQKNEDTLDNRIVNLEVLKSIGDHNSKKV